MLIWWKMELNVAEDLEVGCVSFVNTYLVVNLNWKSTWKITKMIPTAVFLILKSFLKKWVCSMFKIIMSACKTLCWIILFYIVIHIIFTIISACRNLFMPFLSTIFHLNLIHKIYLLFYDCYFLVKKINVFWTSSKIVYLIFKHILFFLMVT